MLETMEKIAKSQFELEQGAKFHVIYTSLQNQQNIMEIRVKDQNDTFEKIKPKIAAYFTLREDLIFFADKNDTIYMEDMQIMETLFPLIDAHVTGSVPEVYVLLQSKMS